LVACCAFRAGLGRPDGIRTLAVGVQAACEYICLIINSCISEGEVHFVASLDGGSLAYVIAFRWLI